MASTAEKRHSGRLRRQRRVRKKIHGTAERPRLAVFRSNKHLSAQLIDDDAGRTIASASSLEAEFRKSGSGATLPSVSARQLHSAPNRPALQKLFMTAVDFCTTVVLQQQRKLLEKKAWSSK